MIIADIPETAWAAFNPPHSMWEGVPIPGTRYQLFRNIRGHDRWIVCIPYNNPPLGEEWYEMDIATAQCVVLHVIQTYSESNSNAA